MLNPEDHNPEAGEHDIWDDERCHRMLNNVLLGYALSLRPPVTEPTLENTPQPASDVTHLYEILAEADRALLQGQLGLAARSYERLLLSFAHREGRSDLGGIVLALVRLAAVSAFSADDQALGKSEMVARVMPGFLTLDWGDGPNFEVPFEGVAGMVWQGIQVTYPGRVPDSLKQWIRRVFAVMGIYFDAVGFHNHENSEQEISEEINALAQGRIESGLFEARIAHGLYGALRGGRLDEDGKYRAQGATHFAIQRATRPSLEWAAYALNTALMYAETGNNERALAWSKDIDDALSEGQGADLFRWLAAPIVARSGFALGHWPAGDYYLWAKSKLWDLAASIPSLDARWKFLGRHSYIFDAAVELFLAHALEHPPDQKPALDAAFCVSDYSRNLGYLMQLQASCGLPELAELWRLQARRSALEYELLRFVDERHLRHSMPVVAKKLNLGTLRSLEWGQTNGRIEKLFDTVGYRSFTSELSPADLQQTLGAEKLVLVEYRLHKSLTMAYVIRGNRVDLWPLVHPRAQVEIACERLRRAMESRDPNAWRQPAQQFYDMLIAPLEESLRDAKEIVLVPDGALWLVPFDVLFVSGQRSAKEADTPSPVITLCGSATAFQLLERAASPASSWDLDFVGFGGPRYPQQPSPDELHLMSFYLRRVGAETLSGFGNRNMALAPDKEKAPPEGTTSSVPGIRFPPLPGANEEVRSLGHLFPADRAVCLTGEQATEGEFKRIVSSSKPRFLHLAAHGIASRQPMLSSIVLALNEDPSEDGFLTARDILGFHIPADLVVLSACSSGVGPTLKGEGVVSLSWAFLCAGARSVVCSLWPVDDNATRLLMERFYSNLLTGKMTKAAALWDAKRTLAHGDLARAVGLSCQAFTHPSFWAGFVLIGDRR